MILKRIDSKSSLTHRFWCCGSDEFLQGSDRQSLLDNENALREIGWDVLVSNVLEKAVTISEAFSG